jgi:hypothetical protein
LVPVQEIEGINLRVDEDAKEADERGGGESCNEENHVTKLDGSLGVILERVVDRVVLTGQKTSQRKGERERETERQTERDRQREQRERQERERERQRRERESQECLTGVL